MNENPEVGNKNHAELSKMFYNRSMNMKNVKRNTNGTPFIINGFQMSMNYHAREQANPL